MRFRRENAPIYLISLAVLIGALFVSVGFFSVDEVVYYLGAKAFAESGKFYVDNGFGKFHSDALRLWYLVNGPNGLVPEYPPGSAILGGVLMPLFGARSLVVLNALATITTLFLTREIAKCLAPDKAVATAALTMLAFATFLIEYAFGIWPHAIAASCSTAALLYALKSLDPPKGALLPAAAAGLASGAGLLFRLDVMFAVPAIIVTMILFARRPIVTLSALGAGMVPPLVIAAWFNFLKFGSFNPLSYGHTGGYTDLRSYAGMIAALGAGFVLLFAFRLLAGRVQTRTWVAGIAGMAIIAIVAVPAARELGIRYCHGFWALIVDARALQIGNEWVVPRPGGAVLFWGLAKKALGQSMPWIGALAILATARWRAGERPAIASLLIFAALATMPLIVLEWPGGRASNMRYFLQVLPAICVLGARIAVDLWRETENPRQTVVTGIWLALLAGAAWAILHSSQYAGVQQILSTGLLLVTALTAFFAGLRSRLQPALKRATLALFAGGFFFAAFFGFTDFGNAQANRIAAHEIGASLADLPRPTLFIGNPELFAANIDGNVAIIADRDRQTHRVDFRLITKALNSGYRVFIPSTDFDASRDLPPGVSAVPTSFVFPGGRAVELRFSRS